MVRGQVIRSDVLGLDEPKLFLVVSSNQRNRAFDSLLCVRLTTTAKQPRASIIEVPDIDTPLHGRVLCDDLMPIWEDEIVEVVGGLGPSTMRLVDAGLLAALGMSR